METTPLRDDTLIIVPLARARIPGELPGCRDAEHIRVEQRPDILLLSFFNGCEIANRCVVHEHIDTTMPPRRW